MKKNANAKHDEIHSTMTETNKRRKQITNQLKKKEEELEELKKVSIFINKKKNNQKFVLIQCICFA